MHRPIPHRNRLPPRPRRGRIILHRPLKIHRPLLQESLHPFLVILAAEQLVHKLAVEQVRGLGRAGSAVHEVFDEREGDAAAVFDDFVSELEGAWEHGFGRVESFGEEV